MRSFNAREFASGLLKKSSYSWLRSIVRQRLSG
jgi:hypothetical protein